MKLFRTPIIVRPLTEEEKTTWSEDCHDNTYAVCEYRSAYPCHGPVVGWLHDDVLFDLDRNYAGKLT